MKDLKIYQLKVVNHADIDFQYEVIDVNAILASHDALCDFIPTLGYKYENERLYHIEKDSQDKVYKTASSLDPAHLLASDFAAYGAPICDNDNNVLGGNGRAMSVILANEKFTHLYNIYANKVREFCKQNDIACNTENPILIRTICQKITKAQGQALITALNDNFTSGKNKNADARSRGMRISQKTLKMLAQGLMQADSLREYFDMSESLKVVKMLIDDGVILESEKIEYINNEYLNSDGKTLIEKALRSQIFPSYDCLMKMPAHMLAKIDAAIPFIIIADSISDYSIQDDIASACTMYAEYCGRTYKNTEIYLNQVNMLTGQAPIMFYGKLATAFFLYLLNSNKKEFVELFKRYASYATQSLEPLALTMGIVKARQEAILAAFNVKIDTDIITSNQKSEISMSKQTSNQEIEIQKTENTSSEKREKKSGRKVKLDCDKQNSKLIASTTESVNVIIDKAHELIDSFKLIENGKTQSKIYVNGHDSGYRIIKSGRQWQLRLLNSFESVKIDSQEIENKESVENSLPAPAQEILKHTAANIISDNSLDFNKHKIDKIRNNNELIISDNILPKDAINSSKTRIVIKRLVKFHGWELKDNYLYKKIDNENASILIENGLFYVNMNEAWGVDDNLSLKELANLLNSAATHMIDKKSGNIDLSDYLVMQEYIYINYCLLSESSIKQYKKGHEVIFIEFNHKLCKNEVIFLKNCKGIYYNDYKCRWEFKDNKASANKKKILDKYFSSDNKQRFLEYNYSYVNDMPWVGYKMSLSDMQTELAQCEKRYNRMLELNKCEEYSSLSKWSRVYALQLYISKLETVISNITNNQSDIIENIEQTLIQADSNITVSENILMIDNEKPRQTTIISQCAIDDNKSDGTGLLSYSCMPLFAACMKPGADKRANKPQNNNPELLPVPKEKTQNKGITGVVKRDKHYRRPYSQALSIDDFALDNKRARIHEFRLLQ